MMKPMLNFFKMTCLGGLLFLLPIVVSVIVFSKAWSIVDELAAPVVKSVPIGLAIGPQGATILALTIVVVACFLSGLLAQTLIAQKVLSRLETTLLSNIPGYEILKTSSESMLGVEKQGHFPVILVCINDAWQVGLKIEEFETNLVTVYIPNAPNPQSGSIYFVTSDCIRSANVSIAEGFDCLRRLGIGSEKFIENLPARRGHPINS